ncbi:MAG: hypothetical protein MJ203_01010 [archaeon]|nr:hypothetical protein [archaeon]
MNLTKILSLFIIGLFVLSCINVVSASIPEDMGNNQYTSDNLLNLVIKTSVVNDVIMENCHFDGSVSNRDDNDVNDKLQDIGKYMPKDISKLGNMY